jgi:hypothetical protein
MDSRGLKAEGAEDNGAKFEKRKFRNPANILYAILKLGSLLLTSD